MTASPLTVTGIEFSYGQTKALKGVSLEVPAGAFVALLGANGAGKTTLFSIITGLYSAHAGDVSIMGQDLRAQTLAALACMGVVFQRSTLDMDLTIRQNLSYAAELQGIASRDASQRIEESLDRLELTEYHKRKVAALSGGQRRRVELARALLHRPSLLLLDEPTVGLDAGSRADFVNHVRSLCESAGTGVLWATHLMDEVEDNDNVFVLDKGEISATGIVRDLLAEHSVTTVAALFNKLVKRQKK